MSDENKNAFDSQNDDSTSFTKYFRMFVFTAPVSNLKTYTTGINKIFDELEKTKLPSANEYLGEMKKEQNKLTTKTLLVGGISSFLLYKFQNISLLNKIFFAGIITTGAYYVFSIQMKDYILNKLVLSQTHFGQESRILTKYFIPDHKLILNIQRDIEYFREHINERKHKLDMHKSNVERLLIKEKELDKIFIDEISAEIDKQENEKKN